MSDDFALITSVSEEQLQRTLVQREVPSWLGEQGQDRAFSFLAESTDVISKLSTSGMRALIDVFPAPKANCLPFSRQVVSDF